jgi:3-oxoacyl-[acyl-carrier-protein] synthase III
MFILGAGAAVASGELSNDVLASLGLALSPEEQSTLELAGVKSRRTSLPLSYIKERRNRDVLEGRPLIETTPTALGVAAVQQALSRAGVSIEQIGLIIADTATPHQTCPSEAQRIAGALGVKVPAYDVIAGSGALPFFIDLLRSWKPERLPEHILCISSNTPSQHVLYEHRALPAYLYGDGASAFVISPRVKGKLAVTDSHLRRHGFLKQSSVVGQHITFSQEAMLSSDEVKGFAREALTKLPKGASISTVVAPALYASTVERVVRDVLGDAPRVISGARDVGYALGATCGIGLSSVWETARSGDHIIVLHVGDGVWGGGVLLASE